MFVKVVSVCQNLMRLLSDSLLDVFVPAKFFVCLFFLILPTYVVCCCTKCMITDNE